MRLSRTPTGRLELTLLDEPDHGVAQDVTRAIVKTFSGVPGQPLHDVDGSTWLDIGIGNARVTVHVSQYVFDTSVLARDEASDGIILDIANYLAANATDLGIEPTIQGTARI
jgi:hypothetical protein